MPSRHLFPATAWTQILTVQAGSSASAEALEGLYGAYWPAIYTYLLVLGCEREEARDLTPDFLTELVEEKKFRFEEIAYSSKKCNLDLIKLQLHDETRTHWPFPTNFYAWGEGPCLYSSSYAAAVGLGYGRGLAQDAAIGSGTL